MTPDRTPLLILLLVLAALLFSGCRFAIGNQKLMLRPGTRVPARSVEQIDGDRIFFEEMDPEGSAIFVFIRGEL